MSRIVVPTVFVAAIIAAVFIGAGPTKQAGAGLGTEYLCKPSQGQQLFAQQR
jgi:hypothetical protein